MAQPLTQFPQHPAEPNHQRRAMLLLPKAAVDRNAHADAGVTGQVVRALAKQNISYDML